MRRRYTEVRIIHFQRFSQRVVTADRTLLRPENRDGRGRLKSGRYPRVGDFSVDRWEFHRNRIAERSRPRMGCVRRMPEKRGICGVKRDFVDDHSTSKASFHFNSWPVVSNTPKRRDTGLNQQNHTRTGNNNDENRKKCGNGFRSEDSRFCSKVPSSRDTEEQGHDREDKKIEKEHRGQP